MGPRPVCLLIPPRLSRLYFGEEAGDQPGTRPGARSGEEPLDDLAAVDDLDRPALGAHVLLGRVDLERVAEAGEQVVDGDWVVLDLAAVGRRGADDLPPLDPAAGQGDAEDAGEV